MKSFVRGEGKTRRLTNLSRKFVALQILLQLTKEEYIPTIASGAARWNIPSKDGVQMPHKWFGNKFAKKARVVDEYHTTKTCSYPDFEEPFENILLNDPSSFSLKYPSPPKRKKKKSGVVIDGGGDDMADTQQQQQNEPKVSHNNWGETNRKRTKKKTATTKSECS